MDEKETRALCVGKVNIFIIYNDNYKEEIGKNVSNYKVANSKQNSLWGTAFTSVGLQTT